MRTRSTICVLTFTFTAPSILMSGGQKQTMKIKYGSRTDNFMVERVTPRRKVLKVTIPINGKFLLS